METAKSFKRKMLLWTNSWFQEKLKVTEKFTPDITEIARILEAVGFRVRLSERRLSRVAALIPGASADCRACEVILKCPHTGLTVELDSPESSCKCQFSNTSTANNETDGKPIEGAEESSLNPNLEISKTVSHLLEGMLCVMSMFPELDGTYNNNNTEKLNFESNLPMETTTRCQDSLTPTNNSNTSATNVPAVAGTAVLTPDAIDVQKPSTGDGKSVPPGRYRSLDTLIASGSGFSDELPEPGQLTPKDDRDYGPEMDLDDDCDLNATIVHGPRSVTRKFISKSSPAFHRRENENFHGSSTFVFDNEKKDSTTNDEKKPTLLRSNTFISDSLTPNAKNEPRTGPPPQKTPTPLTPTFSQSMILKKLKDVRNSISDIIVMFAGNQNTPSDLQKLSDALNTDCSEAAQDKTTDARPVRCLSDFGGVSNLTRVQATKARSIPRLTTRKRSPTTAGQVTPTTSRREETNSLGDKCKKSASTTALGNNRIGQVPSSKLLKIFTPPSSINAGSSRLKNRDTIQLVSTVRKSLTPNRKCPGVQSSVSKAGVIRK